VTHVELSLSQPNLGGPGRPGRPGEPARDPLGSWAGAVASAWEPCVLLNAEGVVVAASPGCSPLFRIPPADAVGRRLVGGVLHLLDFNFTSVPADLADREVEKIPPLLALSTGGLARGLLRVAFEDGTIFTVDAITSAIHLEESIVGSLTFFSPISR
jgi:hypothetical protein